MGDIIDFKNKRNSGASGKGSIESPMRFWATSRCAQAKTVEQPDEDLADMPLEPPAESAIRASNAKNLRYAKWSSTFKERLRVWLHVWLIDTVFFLVLSYTYYPVRDFVLRRVGKRYFHDLIDLSARLSHPNLDINVSLFNGDRIVVHAVVIEPERKSKRLFNVVSGPLPGYCKFFAIRPREMRDAMRRLVHLSKLAKLGYTYTPRWQRYEGNA